MYPAEVELNSSENYLIKQDVQATEHQRQNHSLSVHFWMTKTEMVWVNVKVNGVPVVYVFPVYVFPDPTLHPCNTIKWQSRLDDGWMKHCIQQSRLVDSTLVFACDISFLQVMFRSGNWLWVWWTNDQWIVCTPYCSSSLWYRLNQNHATLIRCKVVEEMSLNSYTWIQTSIQGVAATGVASSL